MAIIDLTYDEVMEASKQAKKVADKCDDYRDEIQKKVVKKLGDLTMGDSVNTSAAKNFACAKIKELDNKKEAFKIYAKNLDNLINDPVDGAKAIDKRVRDKIERQYKNYKRVNEIKVNPVYEALCNLFTGLTNDNGFLRVLKETFNAVKDKIGDLNDWLKYWYRCDGGKEIIKIVGGVIVAVAAVVAVVVAWPVVLAASGVWATIVAVAGFVGAVIAAFDAITNVIHESKALWNIWNNRPADARWDSNTNKITDWLNRSVSDSTALNRFTTGLSKTISVTEFACTIINIASLAQSGFKLVGGLKKAYKQGGWKMIKDHVGIGQVSFKNDKGKFTFKSVKEGITGLNKNIGNTNKYVNRKTKDQGVRIAENLLKTHKDSKKVDKITELAKTYNKFKNFDKKIKPFKTASSFATNVADKGLEKAALRYVHDQSNVFKTIRLTKSGFKSFKDLMCG